MKKRIKNHSNWGNKRFDKSGKFNNVRDFWNCFGSFSKLIAFQKLRQISVSVFISHSTISFLNLHYCGNIKIKYIACNRQITGNLWYTCCYSSLLAMCGLELNFLVRILSHWLQHFNCTIVVHFNTSVWKKWEFFFCLRVGFLSEFGRNFASVRSIPQTLSMDYVA